MSGEHPVHAWRDAIRTPQRYQGANAIGATTRHVALELSCYMNTRRHVWPGAFTLAAGTGLSERTVRTQLEYLEQKGWLVRVRQGGQLGSRGRSTLWRCETPEGVSVVTPAGAPVVRKTTAEADAQTPAIDDWTTEGGSDELGGNRVLQLGRELAGESLWCVRCGERDLEGGPGPAMVTCPSGCGTFDVHKVADAIDRYRREQAQKARAS